MYVEIHYVVRKLLFFASSKERQVFKDGTMFNFCVANRPCFCFCFSWLQKDLVLLSYSFVMFIQCYILLYQYLHSNVPPDNLLENSQKFERLHEAAPVCTEGKAIKLIERDFQIAPLKRLCHRISFLICIFMILNHFSVKWEERKTKIIRKKRKKKKPILKKWNIKNWNIHEKVLFETL